MKVDGKPIFRIGDRAYELVLVDGPIVRDGDCYAARFDHESGRLLVSRRVPVDDRPWLVAVAVSDACFRMWRPVPVGPVRNRMEG